MKEIFDYKKIRQNREKISANLHNKDDLLQKRAKYLMEILQLFRPQQNFPQVLEINSYTGQLTYELQKIAQQIHCTDFSCKMLEINQKKNHKIKIYQTQNEILPNFITQFDLIVDLCSLFLINNLPRILTQIYKLLNKNGIFIGTLLGTGTLIELKEVMIDADLKFFNGIERHIMPFYEIQNLGMLMQSLQFKNVSVMSEKFSLHYDNFSTIINDLRYFGNPLMYNQKKFPITKKYWQEINAKYPYNHHNKMPVTIEFLTIIGHK